MSRRMLWFGISRISRNVIGRETAVLLKTIATDGLRLESVLLKCLSILYGRYLYIKAKSNRSIFKLHTTCLAKITSKSLSSQSKLYFKQSIAFQISAIRFNRTKIRRRGIVTWQAWRFAPSRKSFHISLMRNYFLYTCNIERCICWKPSKYISS